MALLPPYDFGYNPAWWAKSNRMWWAKERSWAYRPTEIKTFIRMALKNWAMREGHYWDWLTEEEQHMHLLDLWLTYYVPTLRSARERADWIHNTLYPHLPTNHIIAIWDTIDAVLHEYAYQHMSMASIIHELWGVDG
jgi:hypothetical protein